MRTILCLLLFILPLSAEDELPFTLKNKFKQAHVGDYLATAQEKNYALLFIREIEGDTLILEEVVVPEEQIDLKKIHWQEWLTKKAPGHTAWTLYEIDMRTGTLTEVYSYSQNGWLFLEETQTFLSKLLTLPLSRVEKEERRKIGPEPQSGDVDTRALWNPPLFLAGKKIPKAPFEAWKTRFPNDSSLLSGCSVQLYFSTLDPTFPFPRWIEIQSPHYNFKLRSVDSGSGLRSPFPGAMPHRLKNDRHIIPRSIEK